MDIKSPNMSMSPCVLNLSSQTKYLMPGGNNGRNFSPMIANKAKTPNLSPIIKPATPMSETKFLRRRESVKERIEGKARRRTCFDVPISKSIINPILEQTICVKSTLKELKLEHLWEIFEREEINTMEIFFTLNIGDLELIGVDNSNDRNKILEFIGSVNTPTKPRAYRY